MPTCSDAFRQHRVDRARELIDRGHYDREDVQASNAGIVLSVLRQPNPDPLGLCDEEIDPSVDYERFREELGF